MVESSVLNTTHVDPLSTDGTSAYPLFAPAGNDSAVAFLRQREIEWSYGIVTASDGLPGFSPEERLLSIFDVFHEWFQRDDYEACVIITVMLEMAKGSPLGQDSLDYLAHVRQIVTSFASEVQFTDPTGFALSWHVLMKGAIFAAVEGDGSAALRAKKMARSLIRESTLSSDVMYDYEFTQTHVETVALDVSETGPDLVDYDAAVEWIEHGDLFAD